MSKNALELREHEEILEECKGDTWLTPAMLLGKQVSGRFYFTNQRIAFRTWGPFKNSAAYDVEYADIASLDTYTVSLFITTGIKINTKDGSLYKISVMKRKKYIELISQYIV